MTPLDIYIPGSRTPQHIGDKETDSISWRSTAFDAEGHKKGGVVEINFGQVEDKIIIDGVTVTTDSNTYVGVKVPRGKKVTINDVMVKGT